ncbi:hypothetical protein AC579_4268 [Pseudocercospora musae]|uniref:UBC core domain-containing protein n=1 Tax=Pseudocercospora musae TaxID=113226 RepID=A0A139I6W7_9PEZI|nr:hypothetical protein AC579_4268 [Pseudocercospora musae]
MATNQQFLLERRLKDINELQQKPHPGIRIHIDDADLTTACLVLEPQGETPLHLTLHFDKYYPLVPPDRRQHWRLDYNRSSVERSTHFCVFCSFYLGICWVSFSFYCSLLSPARLSRAHLLYPMISYFFL